MTPQRGLVANRCGSFFVPIFTLASTPTTPKFSPFQGDSFGEKISPNAPPTPAQNLPPKRGFLRTKTFKKHPDFSNISPLKFPQAPSQSNSFQGVFFGGNRHPDLSPMIPNAQVSTRKSPQRGSRLCLIQEIIPC